MSRPRPVRTALFAGLLVFAWGFCPCALARALGGIGMAAPARKACCKCCRNANEKPTRHAPADCPGCAAAGCSKGITAPDAPADLERPEAAVALVVDLPIATGLPVAPLHLPEAVSPGPPRDCLATVVLTL